MSLKDSLRNKYLVNRKNIPNKNEKSEIIFNKIIKNEIYINSRTIGIYMNLDSEVDTKKIIDYSIKNNKIVAIPKVVGNNLEFYQIKSLNDNFVKSPFNILEPISTKENYIDKSNIDLLIVPGICFDNEGNRIGFGKGYYDRYLNNSNIKTIGICFKEQITTKIIPTNRYDVKIDVIITD